LQSAKRAGGGAGARCYDGLKRISSQTLLDLLEVLQRSRTAGTYRRVARLMAELGWTASNLSWFRPFAASRKSWLTSCWLQPSRSAMCLSGRYLSG